VGDSDFELSIPSFLVLHPIFNVYLLQPYFPPLLDTLEVEEHLTPRDIKLDYIKQETIDQIMNARVKGYFQ
jgi:hypothetical protein